MAANSSAIFPYFSISDLTLVWPEEEYVAYKISCINVKSSLFKE